MCVALRRAHSGPDERLLVHFNGHGVPRPSVNGEVWVFNRSFTQYIPVSAYDLQTWLGTPCILVLDCSNAGRIIEALGSMEIFMAASRGRRRGRTSRGEIRQAGRRAFPESAEKPASQF